MNKIGTDFYRRDTLTVARELIGKILFRYKDGYPCSGIIVETEAYLGKCDRACHSYKADKNGRTGVMYLPGGIAYVYLIYGMYCCFNIVTRNADEPEAVLVRAVEPVTGIDIMCARRSILYRDDMRYRDLYKIASGPGKLCKAFSITREDSGSDLCGDAIYILDGGINANNDDILATPRKNIGYAGEDILLPYRFILKYSRFISK